MNIRNLLTDQVRAALPPGMHITTDGNGHCLAELPSGAVMPLDDVIELLSIATTPGDAS